LNKSLLNESLASLIKPFQLAAVGLGLGCMDHSQMERLLFFPAFVLELHHSAPGSQAFGLRLELNHWLCWDPSLPTHPVDLGLASLHNHISQFLINKRIPYWFQYLLLVLFLWRTLTNSVADQPSETTGKTLSL
jgi:hypothetical protein